MKILLTNDDGIKSTGIEAIKNALITSGHTVTIVAPSENQSGCSHSMRFYNRIMLKKVEEGEGYVEYSLSGSPADCVKLGLSKLMPDADLVISGVNDLANSGTDLLYSGTFNGAFEGTVCGVDSIAISACREKYIPSAVEFLIKNLSIFKEKFFSKPYTININVPNYLDKIKGVKVCPLGEKKYTDLYQIFPTENEVETEYFLYGDEIFIEKNPSGVDVNLLNEGYITITPTKLELVNNYEYCNILKEIKLL
ncbi:MAG: 5'/3'-nucleotidase SurE [Clostridia bacterium]|nr:5'/3'-nucleotidase SurE [Clostridia bacterium]MDY5263419.1 5'/3'-nucleotidase SurE [Eubacteriales bacterium]